MKGIRILEVAEHTFVPVASAVLADWGAEVVKIEHIERGDAMRGLASTGVMSFGDGVHVLMEHSNRGKQSLALDLSKPEGVAIVYRLAKDCDVFLTNKLPAVRRRLAIDVDDIRAHNPDIVYVSGTGHGERGPDADNGGYDALSYWYRSGSAMGGMALDAETVPVQPAPAYGDSLGGMTIAGGIMGALLHRERTGEATTVDVSLMSTGLWAMAGAIALSLQTGEAWRPPKDGARTNPLTGLYRTSDGRFISLNCLQAFRYWPDACRVIGRPELAADERFSSHPSLAANAAVARQMLIDVFAGSTLSEWRSRLADFSGQWGVVQDCIEVAEDPQTEANGFLGEATSVDGIPFTLVTPPVQFGGVPAAPGRAPAFNEHCEKILSSIGLDADAILDLRVKGVVA